jgi:hypothetical protein
MGKNPIDLTNFKKADRVGWGGVGGGGGNEPKFVTFVFKYTVWARETF